MNKLSPERIEELKNRLSYPEPYLDEQDKEDFLAILDAYANQGGAQVTDEDKREMLGIVADYLLSLEAELIEEKKYPESLAIPSMEHEIGVWKKIHSIILAPAKTVSREWFEKLVIGFDGEYNSLVEPALRRMLCEQGISVEPEKEPK